VRRRDFIGSLGAAVAWPVVARGQHRMPIVGFLNGSSANQYDLYVRAFLQGLKEAGYIDGQNVAVEFRWAEGDYDRLPQMAADLARHQVAVIAANTPATRAAKQATSTIPIVFFSGEDPVASGLVTSLNRPGGNVTGVTTMFGALAAKQFGLLSELVPSARSIFFLVNPRNPISEPNIADAEKAARTLQRKIQVLYASNEAEIDTAFETLTQVRAGALLVQPDAFLINKKIVTLAARHAVATMYQVRDLTLAGGLLSYGPSPSEMYHQMGVYTGKILNGANPAEMPVLQPTKFDLVINLKTANALRLEIPPKILALADEVIE
jgi:putative ABC transport system substrate-binding protein